MGFWRWLFAVALQFRDAADPAARRRDAFSPARERRVSEEMSEAAAAATPLATLSLKAGSARQDEARLAKSEWRRATTNRGFTPFPQVA